MSQLKSVCCQTYVEEKNKIAEFYDKGYSDTAIAEKLGLSRVAVALWRKSQGLESNYLKFKKSLNYGPELVSKCKGCLYADESKRRCEILTEPGWFWQEGKSCSFRKDKKAMKAKEKESEIRSRVKEYLEWKGWFVFYHLQGLGSYPGLPDLQAVKNGRTVYIEIKCPGGRLSEKQKKFQRDLEAAGGKYIIARGIEDVSDI